MSHAKNNGLLSSMCPSLVFVTVVCLASIFLGVCWQKNNWWPLLQLWIAKARLTAKPIQTDYFGRLVQYPGKVEVACPAQHDLMAVLLVFGQSNSANHQGQRYRGLDGQVFNFAEGKCYIAESPLLGAEGEFGDSWTLLANKLIAAGPYRQVVLIPAGVGATEIHRWSTGGDLNKMLVGVIDDALRRYTITHVLFHQGDTDFRLKTSEANYRRDLLTLIGSIRALGVHAPFYVSKASFEESYNGWSPENPITAAQASRLIPLSQVRLSVGRVLA